MKKNEELRQVQLTELEILKKVGEHVEQIEVQ